MITKSIYSYRVIIKYGVYTRTIIGVFSFQSLSNLPSAHYRFSLFFALCPKPTGSGVVLWEWSSNSGVEYSLWGFPLVQANAEAEIITRNQF